MTTETLWLTDAQQYVWRRWLRLNRELSATLGRDLLKDSELSMPDFEALVYLTDVEEGRLRISALAGAMDWERSRLSHHIKRMEARGLVTRAECPEDGRGAFVAITPAGRAAIQRAAPAHVRSVRRLVIDVLSDEELEQLGRITDKLLAQLH